MSNDLLRKLQLAKAKKQKQKAQATAFTTSKEQDNENTSTESKTDSTTGTRSNGQQDRQEHKRNSQASTTTKSVQRIGISKTASLETLRKLQSASDVPTDSKRHSDNIKNTGTGSGKQEASTKQEAGSTSLLERIRQGREYSTTTDSSTGSADTSTEQPRPTRDSNVLDATVVKKVVEETTDEDRQRGKDEICYDDLNEKQLLAIEYGTQDEPFVLIGPAGSGKTTTVRGMAMELVRRGTIGRLNGYTKTLQLGAPAVAIVSFTNQAVRNIKEALPDEFKTNCTTIHSLLEYAPDKVDKLNPETGEFEEVFKFLPTYGTLEHGNKEEVLACDKLPHLDMIVIEEAGTVSLSLYRTLLSALPYPERTQIVMLGDLNQLPPVFDDAILGFGLLDYKCVELERVYRNVGLVTKLAHRILKGKAMTDNECSNWNLTDDSGTIRFMPFPKWQDWEKDLKRTGESFRRMAREGRFSLQDDVVLIPFNVKFGAIEMNNYILQGITERDNLTVYQVRAGYNVHHLCVGDRVLFNKRYQVITAIEPNKSYVGEPVLPASKYIDRWGNIHPEHRDEVLGLSTGIDASTDDGMDALESMLEAAGNIMKGDINDKETIRRSASHKISMRPLDPNDNQGTLTVGSAGDVNNLIQTAAMTVNKAQGSEFKNVYFILHHSHSVMLNRELLYTGVTRARRNLTIIYSGQHPTRPNQSVFQKGIIRQAIEGITLEQKLTYFRSKRKAEEIQKRIAERKAKKQLLKDEAEELSNGK